MTRQAMDYLNLCKGGNKDSIERLLRMQSRDIVKELKDAFKARGINDLAYKLSVFGN